MDEREHPVRRVALILPPRLKVGGFFRGQIVRAGRVIDEFEDHNLIVNQGLDHILATEFCAGAPITSWYLAPFANNYTPIATDTAASIANNAGEISDYSGAGRVPYKGLEASQQVTNQAAPSTFTFTAAATVYGAFLISSAARASTAGTLFAAAQFATPKPVAVDDQLLLTYSFAAASA